MAWAWKRAAGASFAVLAVATGACAQILGDFPDGDLAPADGSSDAFPFDGGTDAVIDAGGCEIHRPEGALGCFPKTKIIDIALDDAGVYWLEPEAMRTCDKRGCGDAGPRTVVSFPDAAPYAMAVNQNDVFWTIAAEAEAGGGLWKCSKECPTPPARVWHDYPRKFPGPIAQAEQYVATAETVGPSPAIWYYRNTIEGGGGEFAITNAGVNSITMLNDVIYWSIPKTREILRKPITTGDASLFSRVSSGKTPKSLITSDTWLRWANVDDAGLSQIVSQCVNGGSECASQNQIADGVEGLVELASYRFDLYWTANEPTEGVVRKCQGGVCVPSPYKYWNSAETTVGPIAVDATGVYFAGTKGNATFIVKLPR